MEFTVIGRIEPDCLLAQRFFTTPSARTDLDVFKCDFRLPQSAAADAMDFFFSHPVGYQFCKGVERLLVRLKNIGNEKQIDMSALDVFYGNLNHDHPTPDYHFPYTPASYQLMTEGIKMLNAIATLLEAGDVYDDLKERVLKSLGSDLNVCAPGCYTVIQGNYLKLVKNPDIVMLEMRTDIAQQVAQELIYEYNRSISGSNNYEALQVYEGNDTHYVAAILNATAHEFGFKLNRDAYVPPASETEYFIETFRNRLLAQLTGQMLLERIIEKLNVAQLIQKIAASPQQAAEHCENFKNELDQYGIDEAFNINMLFKQDKLMDLQYELSADADSYLFISILIRLTKSGFINADVASRSFQLSDMVVTYFPFHPLTYSFVVNNESGERNTFISYCVEYFKTMHLMPVDLVDSKHIAELNTAVVKEIEHDDIFRLSPISLKTDQEKIHFYSLIGAVTYRKLLTNLLNIMPDNVVNSFIQHVDESHKRSNIETSDQYQLVVQSYFASNQFTFSSHEDIVQLSSYVDSFKDMIIILSLITESKRYQFLLLVGKKALDLIADDKANVIAVMSLLAVNERNQLLHHLHFSSDVITKLDLPALSSMLNLIAPEHYVTLIHYMLGMNRFMRLLPAIDTCIQILMAIPVNARIHFIKAASLDYFVYLFENKIANLGKLMAQLPVPDQMAVLSHWYPAGYQGLFSSFELLQEYLQPLQPESRAAFLCALPTDLLQQWTTNPLMMNKLLQQIPAYQHSSLQSHLQQQNVPARSYWSFLFTPVPQTRTSTEQREAARMHRYDHR